MKDMIIDEQAVELPAGKINFLRAGNSGPALVLLHGAMLDSAQLVWGAVIENFAADFQVFAPDWPNHGASRPWSAGSGERALVDCLSALLDHWQLDRAHLVGRSLGGAIATRFTLDHPDRVDRLVLVGPGGFDQRRPYQWLTNAFLKAPGLNRLLTRIYARNPSWVRSSLKSAMAAGESTPGFEEIVRLAYQEAAAKDLAGNPLFDDYQVEAYGPREMKINYQPELPALGVPTLLVRGAVDSAVDAEPLQLAARTIPDATYLELAGAGHVGPRDVPDEFARTVRSFLTSQPS